MPLDLKISEQKAKILTLAEHFNRVRAAYSQSLKPRLGELGFQAARTLEGMPVRAWCDHYTPVSCVQPTCFWHREQSLFFTGAAIHSRELHSLQLSTINIQRFCALSALLGSLGSCPGDKARNFEDVGSAKLLHGALDCLGLWSWMGHNWASEATLIHGTLESECLSMKSSISFDSIGMRKNKYIYI